jgi:uncharacterized damage-inducible protein DinB
MAASDPFEILLAHDRWATQNIIDTCATLTSEQFHRKFEMGPGSLHDTVMHIIGAMGGWGDLLAGRQFRARPEGISRAIPELQALYDETSADFAASAKAHPLDDLVTRERDGKSFTFTRGGVVTHVTTHGMHHRAQCLNMLRRVGMTTLPQSSVLQWMLAAKTNG